MDPDEVRATVLPPERDPSDLWASVAWSALVLAVLIAALSGPGPDRGGRP